MNSPTQSSTHLPTDICPELRELGVKLSLSFQQTVQLQSLYDHDLAMVERAYPKIVEKTTSIGSSDLDQLEHRYIELLQRIEQTKLRIVQFRKEYQDLSSTIADDNFGALDSAEKVGAFLERELVQFPSSPTPLLSDEIIIKTDYSASNGRVLTYSAPVPLSHAVSMIGTQLNTMSINQFSALAKPDVPLSHPSSSVFHSALIPPFFQFMFTIPFAMDSFKYSQCCSSSIFQIKPFPFKWCIHVFPRGCSLVKETYKRMSVFIELVEGMSSADQAEYLLRYPPLAPSAAHHHIVPTTYKIPHTATLRFAAETDLNKKRVVQHYHPHCFDYSLELVPEDPINEPDAFIKSTRSAPAMQTQGTARFFVGAKERVGSARFAKTDDIVGSPYEWKEDKSVHILLGIRFPSYKRIVELLEFLAHKATGQRSNPETIKSERQKRRVCEMRQVAQHTRRYVESTQLEERSDSVRFIATDQPG